MGRFGFARIFHSRKHSNNSAILPSTITIGKTHQNVDKAAIQRIFQLIQKSKKPIPQGSAFGSTHLNYKSDRTSDFSKARSQIWLNHRN
ncbi:MAG: hypothetical protein QNJ47_12915 [Nostocaceae cyanobacterium]|nr:hypothetical protein [Nostocaceae cyanobacterium]